jgi:hypothetical protein
MNVSLKKIHASAVASRAMLTSFRHRTSTTMNHMKAKFCIFLFSLIVALPALNAEIQTGDTFPELKVKDQHEVDYSLEAGVRYILVSFDMPTGKAANKFLEKKGATYLPENQAVFLSNIYGMPWIGRKFALPKMMKYPHRILLADEPEEAMLAEFPQQDDRVTVFQIDAGRKITAISFWNPESGSGPFKN